MIYLASVYSLNADENLREQRYKYALKKAAEFTVQSVPIFSPVVHSHDMGIQHSLPCTFDFWRKLDFQYLDVCSDLYILMMDGYEDSIGVSAERDYAFLKNIPITYIKCEDSPPASSYNMEAA